MIKPGKALGFQFGVIVLMFTGFLDSPSFGYAICFAACVAITVHTFTEWVEGLINHDC